MSSHVPVQKNSNESDETSSPLRATAGAVFQDGRDMQPLITDLESPSAPCRRWGVATYGDTARNWDLKVI